MSAAVYDSPLGLAPLRTGCRKRLPCVRWRRPASQAGPERVRTCPSEGGPPRMIDQQPTVLNLTDAAATKLHELTKEETNPDIGLRVYVYSGGCSGDRYGVMLEGAPTEEDPAVGGKGVKGYVDGPRRGPLPGAQIGYIDTPMGAGF